MGQKVNPHGMRIGVNKSWNANWFASKQDFASSLKEDNVIRTFIKKTYYDEAISKIVIERNAGKLFIRIFSAKPRDLIGNGDKDTEGGVAKLKKQISELTTCKDVFINIQPVKNRAADAQLVAEDIATQLEKRVSFRRAMKQAMRKAMEAGAKGIKTKVSGRLDGAEIARAESYREGSIPLHTLRANIDYATATAHTTFGCIGVKVWIYRGDIIGKQSVAPQENEGGQANVNA